MYHRRFKNRSRLRLFNLKGHFSLMHIGGGTFVYSFPGKNHPVVGKIEFGRKKYRVQGLGALIIGSAFFSMMSLLSNAGSASSINPEDLERMNRGLSPVELEKKSEELKTRLLSDGRDDRTNKPPLVRYTVLAGETMAALSSRYHVPIDMIAASSRISPQTVLQAGQQINIPNRAGIVYRLRNGDSLAGILDYYSVNYEEFFHDNPEIRDPDMVEGAIFLPNAKIPDPPPTWIRPGWGIITSGFGLRVHPLLGPGHLQMHAGIDFGMSYGAVRSARAGRVQFAGYLGTYGNAVIIEHDNAYKTLYAHLSRNNVRSGQYVDAGAVIAVSGNTGMSTGPHLHFELIRYGRSVNPWGYVHF